MKLRVFLTLCLVLAVTCCARAEDRLTLDGTVEQGGLLRGRTEPGAKLALNGAPIRVAPDGRFILGFDRDAPEHATLTVSFADGITVTRDIAVERRHYDIQRIAGLPQAMVTPDPALLERIGKENEEVQHARASDSDTLFFEEPFQWPALGPISGVYGSQRILNGEARAPHLGTDIAAAPGTPIVAAGRGTVTLAEPDLYLTGGTVIIDHGYGLSTTYLHMATVEVKQGQDVQQGERIGTVGATGRATGPHLHWGINWYQIHLDPQLIAGPMPKQE